jgi:hypothetical protein
MQKLISFHNGWGFSLFTFCLANSIGRPLVLNIGRRISGQGLGVENACDGEFVSGTGQVKSLLLKVRLEV